MIRHQSSRVLFAQLPHGSEVRGFIVDTDESGAVTTVRGGDGQDVDDAADFDLVEDGGDDERGGGFEKGFVGGGGGCGGEDDGSEGGNGLGEGGGDLGESGGAVVEEVVVALTPVWS